MSKVLDLGEIREHIRRYSTAFVPLFENKQRYQIVWGGAGSGKSHIIARKLLLRILDEENVKHNILVIRKVGETIKRSVFKLIVDLIDKWGIRSEFKINKTDKIITQIHGNSQIMFSGLDDVEKIKSIEGVTCIWIEEATELLQEDFEQLDLRLRGEFGTYKQIILTLNPISAEHWIKKIFFDNPMPNVFTLKTTYLDNEFIDDEYKEVLESKKLTNPRYYKIYALGEWGTAEGLVFQNVTTRIIREEEIKGLECVQSGDFGYTNDPTAFNITYIDKKKMKLFVYDGFYEKGLGNGDIANRLKEMKAHRHLSTWDSSEPKSIASLKAKGINARGAKKGRDSINAGIDFLLDYEIIINAHLTDFYKEALNYSWKIDKNNKMTNKPIDEWNHFWDSLRYGTEHLQTRRGRLGKISKPLGI